MDKPIKKRRWLPTIIGIFLLLVLWQVLTNTYREEEKELRVKLRETVKEKYPEQAARFSEETGLFRFKGDEEIGSVVQEERSIVLIHGLDDPGKVWRSLAPELGKEGFSVWLMQYPNDQPIVESSRFFTEELKDLRLTGIESITIVAHSMGGLVAREMLTSPEIQYSTSVKNSLVPEVDELIMVGTPNQGSQLARFRVFSEMRDYLARLTKGEASWQGMILDGAGEAKIDLVPGSSFLTELNGRPHPEAMDMFIVAGITSPWNEGDIDMWAGDLRKKVTEDQQDLVDEVSGYLMLMTRGLGDGLVTVESALLTGVPYRTVDGTHLSMIRNVMANSERIPPAVPVVVDHLKGME
jgi:pimeloyl-ACP methyl ester carboxylesterase